MDGPSPNDLGALIGRTVAGKFDVLSLVGAGGMGAVFRARHRDLGTTVALKVLLGQDAECILRFEREAESLARIDHRCIVRVLDFGRDSTGFPYLAMEHVDGVDLRALVESQGALPLERVVAIGADILAGLAAVHDVGVVHRDLKPGNILVTKTRDDDGKRVEHAKICDFGIASYHGAEANSGAHEPLTQAGFVVGTPEYMAPEQVVGRVATPRSDLYAVGVLLFELATGTRPYAGTTAVEVAIKHVSAAIPLPSSRVILPESFDAFCTRALSKDEASRYADARTMRRALLDVLREHPARQSDATIAISRLRASSPKASADVPSTGDALAFPTSPQDALDDEEFPLLRPQKPSRFGVGAAFAGLALVGVGFVLANSFGGDGPKPGAGRESLTVAATGAGSSAARAQKITPTPPAIAASPPAQASVHSTPSRALVVRSTDFIEPAQGGVHVAPASPKFGPLAPGGDSRSGIAPATLPNTAPTVADALHEIRQALGSVTRVQAGQGLSEGDIAGQADRAKKALERCTMGSAGQLRPGNLGELVARLQVSPDGKVVGVVFDDAPWPDAARACAQRSLMGLYLPHALPTSTGATIGLGLILN